MFKDVGSEMFLSTPVTHSPNSCQVRILEISKRFTTGHILVTRNVVSLHSFCTPCGVICTYTCSVYDLFARCNSFIIRSTVQVSEYDRSASLGTMVSNFDRGQLKTDSVPSCWFQRIKSATGNIVEPSKSKALYITLKKVGWRGIGKYRHKLNKLCIFCLYIYIYFLFL